MSLAVVLFAILAFLVFPLVMDRLTPYARACRAAGGEPAISNQVCYVKTVKTIMQR